jgi:hypothetical protein
VNFVSSGFYGKYRCCLLQIFIVVNPCDNQKVSIRKEDELYQFGVSEIRKILAVNGCSIKGISSCLMLQKKGQIFSVQGTCALFISFSENINRDQF